MVRSGKNSVKRGVWIAEEDEKVPAFVSKHGSGDWTTAPKKEGLKRCGKSCRLRWSNILRPDLKQDNFTHQEEELIIKLHAAIGSRWNIIAQQLPGRTDNDVKIFWNTKVKKKLSQMGIDPVTHKPFSKLIADYGNINGNNHKPSNTQVGPENKDFIRNGIMLPHEFRNTSDQQKQQPKMEITNGNSFLVCEDLSMGTNACSTSTQGGGILVPFSWNDFLLEDAFAPSFGDRDNQEEQENVIEVTSQQASRNDFHISSSSSSSEISFVEAMLGQENEMFPSFPHLLEEPSNY